MAKSGSRLPIDGYPWPKGNRVRFDMRIPAPLLKLLKNKYGRGNVAAIVTHVLTEHMRGNAKATGMVRRDEGSGGGSEPATEAQTEGASVKVDHLPGAT